MDELIFIVGRGETSSLNIQANLEEYFASAKRKKKSIALVIPYNTKPSPGQVIAHQFGNQNGVESIVWTDPESDISQFSNAHLNYYAGPATQAAGELMKDTPAKVFMLFDDEDVECNTWLQVAQHYTVASFDLCQGLLPIDPVAVITPILTPDIPEVEKVPVKASQPVLEAFEDSGTDEDDEYMDDQDEDNMTDLWTTIYEIAYRAARKAIADVEKEKAKEQAKVVKKK